MAVRILHGHSTFGRGGKEARAVRLMNAFGDAAEHAIVSADARRARRPRRRSRAGSRSTSRPTRRRSPACPGLPRLFRLSRYMRRFDLVLTYNWGAFDAVMARHLFGGPPLIHHEDGFNEDEAGELKTRAQPLPPARPSAALPAGRALGAARGDRPQGLGAAAGASRADRQRHRRRRYAAAPRQRDPGLDRATGRDRDRHRRRASRRSRTCRAWSAPSPP